jgi:hypothetical protein
MKFVGLRLIVKKYNSVKYVVPFLTLLVSQNIFAQNDFDLWFENYALRIDYYLVGDSENQYIYLDDILVEPYWSGSHSSTIDKQVFGTHRIEVYDKLSSTLIFSKGFCTLYQEWQTTLEAQNLPRAFEQVTRIPFPKQDVVIKLIGRDSEGTYSNLYEFEVDPKSILINRRLVHPVDVIKIVDNGPFNQRFDLVFIAEGYTAGQIEKFRADAKRFTDYLFAQAPFNQLIESINVWVVEPVSENEGPSNPGKGYWNNSPTHSSFYTFGIERYLTTSRFKRVMDIAANAPGDLVYILANSSEYGGGGIYNHYCLTTTDHELSNIVFIHELGHGLAGLGDEYYTSDVAYQNFYPLNVEPWEPNLTTLVDFSKKWGNLMNKSTPIPTPLDEAYMNQIGVFEGGGYMEKSVFRPYIDCRMKSNEAPGFCPVCQKIIISIIETYSN